MESFYCRKSVGMQIRIDRKGCRSSRYRPHVLVTEARPRRARNLLYAFSFRSAALSREESAFLYRALHGFSQCVALNFSGSNTAGSSFTFA